MPVDVQPAAEQQRRRPTGTIADLDHREPHRPQVQRVPLGEVGRRDVRVAPPRRGRSYRRKASTVRAPSTVSASEPSSGVRRVLPQVTVLRAAQVPPCPAEHRHHRDQQGTSTQPPTSTVAPTVNSTGDERDRSSPVRRTARVRERVSTSREVRDSRSPVPAARPCRPAAPSALSTNSSRSSASTCSPSANDLYRAHRVSTDCTTMNTAISAITWSTLAGGRAVLDVLDQAADQRAARPDRCIAASAVQRRARPTACAEQRGRGQHGGRATGILGRPGDGQDLALIGSASSSVSRVTVRR